MTKKKTPQIMLERRAASGDANKIAHMCSNCHVYKSNIKQLLASIEKGADWEVTVINSRTVRLKAPAGVMFAKDIYVPVEEIMMAILETRVLRQRAQRPRRKARKKKK